MCITGCPYKKIYFNWKAGSLKYSFCYPRIRSGSTDRLQEPVGRIRYLDVR